MESNNTTPTAVSNAAPEEGDAVHTEQLPPPPPEAPLADPESSGETSPDEETSDATATDEPPPSDDAAGAAATNTDEAATEAVAEAAAATDDGPSTSDRADRVSTDNPILHELEKYSNQLCRIIILCRHRLSNNTHIRDTILGLDAILAQQSAVEQNTPSSFVNAMIDIYKSVVASVPRAFQLLDIETTRRNVFKFYNLEHVLATRCRRRSQRLASKRRHRRRQHIN